MLEMKREYNEIQTSAQSMAKDIYDKDKELETIQNDLQQTVSEGRQLKDRCEE